MINPFKRLHLTNAAKEHYGESATIKANWDHIDQLMLVLGDGREFPISRENIEWTAKKEHGQYIHLVTIGVTSYDWRALDFSDLIYKVVPVILVAPEKWENVAEVSAAIANVRSALRYAKEWYSQFGLNFEFVIPLVLKSKWNIMEWEGMTHATVNDPDKRFQIWRAVIADYRNSELPNTIAGEHVFVGFPFCGFRNDLGHGAAGGNAWVALGPTSVACMAIPAFPLQKNCWIYQQRTYEYALLHELGHCFGRTGHHNNSSSVMATALPPEAVLLPEDISQMICSSIFKAK